MRAKQVRVHSLLPYLPEYRYYRRTAHYVALIVGADPRVCPRLDRYCSLIIHQPINIKEYTENHDELMQKTQTVIASALQ